MLNTVKYLISAFIILVLGYSYIGMAETTRGTPAERIDFTNRDFENIGTNQFVRLDSYEGFPLPGFELQCFDNDPSKQKIMFCETLVMRLQTRKAKDLELQ